ncbi:MAG: YkgJ family cysteine cluster protein [Planctomycetes bacterium]|nr:YkgJ family cysteine cluster protein [Planctomycetota bacterium]
MSAAELDCQLCGACCCSDSPGHVPLSGEDHARLTPSEQRALTEFRGTRCFMRMRRGRCVNLELHEGRFACAIYPRRPQVCRDYERGGPACDLDRERFMERARMPHSFVLPEQPELGFGEG